MRSEPRAAVDFGKMIWGITVLGVGVLGWLYQAEYLTLWEFLGFWPIYLVALGLSILVRPARATRAVACGCGLSGRRRRGKPRSFGLILVLLGLLLLLDNFDLYPFSNSWAVLLVVIGIVMVLRALAESSSPPFGPAASQEKRDG